MTRQKHRMRFQRLSHVLSFEQDRSGFWLCQQNAADGSSLSWRLAGPPSRCCQFGLWGPAELPVRCVLMRPFLGAKSQLSGISSDGGGVSARQPCSHPTPPPPKGPTSERSHMGLEHQHTDAGSHALSPGTAPLHGISGFPSPSLTLVVGTRDEVEQTCCSRFICLIPQQRHKAAMHHVPTPSSMCVNGGGKLTHLFRFQETFST